MPVQTTPVTKESFLRQLNNPRGNVYLCELLKAAVKMPTRKDKIDILQAYAARKPNYSESLRYLVELLYHPAVSFDLPAGDPPFRPIDAADEELAHTTLLTELRNVKLFLKGANRRIPTDMVRERTFVQTLEKLCVREAKLLLMCKDKKLDKRVYPTIDASLFREAFPTWLPGDDSKNASTPA